MIITIIVKLVMYNLSKQSSGITRYLDNCVTNDGNGVDEIPTLKMSHISGAIELL